MNQEKFKTAEEYLLSYEKLVHKVVHECGIFSGNEAYDDYCQVARLALHDKYTQFTELAQKECSISELFHLLKWRIRDYQRSMQRQQRIVEKEMHQTRADDFVVTIESEAFEWVQFMEVFWQQLSANEQLFLSMRLVNSSSIKEIAATAHVSRQTVSQWKRSVGNKFALFQQQQEQ